MKDSDDFGHVKLSRKIFDPIAGDDFWFERRAFSRFEAWLDVIQLAAFNAHKRTTEHYGQIELSRGEFIASLRWLAERWDWSIKKVRNWIELGEKRARITAVRETRAGTVYLIINYDRYQLSPERKGTHKGTDDGIEGAQQGHSRGTSKKAGIKQELEDKDLTTLSPSARSTNGTHANSEVRTGASHQLGLVVDPPSDVQVVLDHYVAVHPRRRPGDADRRHVERALKRGYSPAELCEAIDGNAADEWHARKKKHDLEYVLRDGKVDGFRESAAASKADDDQPLVDEFGCLTAYGELATRP